MPDYNLDVLPGYRVGSDGTVSRWIKKRKQWKYLKINAKGNVFVGNLATGEKKSTRSVGRLVLRAFGPPRPLGDRVLHYPDPDPRNNAIENLRWAPANSGRFGDPRLSEYGRKSGVGERSRVLSDASAAQALEMLGEGITAAEVSEYLGVHRGVIDRLIDGSLPHIPRPPGIEPIGNRWARGDDHYMRRFDDDDD